MHCRTLWRRKTSFCFSRGPKLPLSALGFQMTVEVIHEQLERLALNWIRLVLAFVVPVHERITMHRVIEAHPSGVLAGFLHPLMREPEDALQMIGLAANVEDRRPN